MNENFEKRYSKQTDDTLKYKDRFKLAIGGAWDFMGILQYDILKYGLKTYHYLADIGCGNGRLANRLVEREGPYYGQDINDGLLDEIRKYKKTQLEN